ncbi:hypothetical protein C9374_013937 [Naegleria lovaniensis]|uniref:Uncharacterized protein n=1 Tax=Naegleria lovaniensis TaxID=51637 RepID=A0AA88GUZ5_NAELO|nr:uncharacterized protein C9374_013937 [Naegleria lovaniensis]KAG2389377.1 hypothetical protein C9374_013937 [Naegleria lovaniensis]
MQDEDDLLLGAVEEEAMAQHLGFTDDFDHHQTIGASSSSSVGGSSIHISTAVNGALINNPLSSAPSTNHHHLMLGVPTTTNNGHLPQAPTSSAASHLIPSAASGAFLHPLLGMSLTPLGMHPYVPLPTIPQMPLPNGIPQPLLGLTSPASSQLLSSPVSFGHRVLPPSEEPSEEEQEVYEVYDDDKQDPTEFPTLAQEDVTNEQRLDEILSGLPISEEQERMKYYVAHGVKYPFVAQWRNPLIHSIRENVIVKHVVTFNQYFGVVVIVEPLYVGADKKKKKTTVTDLRRTGFYVHAADLYGMKKKSVIGRLLDDHRKYRQRCILVNETKALYESQDVQMLKTKCEAKIPKINEITNLLSNMTQRLKSSEDPELVTVVNRYESQGGNPPQKINKKLDVAKSLEIDEINERITSLCPPGTGSINDLPTLVRYATTCLKFPFEAKVTSLYSFLNDQQVEFTVLLNSVNYRCKQGIIFKGSILSGRLEPIDQRFKVHVQSDDDDDSDTEDGPANRKKRKMSSHTSLDSFNGQSVKVECSRLRFEDPKSVNFKILLDYQTWFCQSTLLDEKKVDDQWNNLRFYLQFVE